MALILMIEDEAALQEAYTFLLNSQGHTVHSAYNGKEGLERVRTHTYDLIILDINMPVMGGLEFLRRFGKKNAKDTAVMVFSNVVDKGVEQEALHNGAESVVLKSSVTPREFIDLIEKKLQKA